MGTEGSPKGSRSLRMYFKVSLIVPLHGLEKLHRSAMQACLRDTPGIDGSQTNRCIFRVSMKKESGLPLRPGKCQPDANDLDSKSGIPYSFRPFSINLNREKYLPGFGIGIGNMEIPPHTDSFRPRASRSPGRSTMLPGRPARD